MVVVVVAVAFLAVLFVVRVVDRLGHWAESLDIIVFRTTHVRQSCVCVPILPLLLLRVCLCCS